MEGEGDSLQTRRKENGSGGAVDRHYARVHRKADYSKSAASDVGGSLGKGGKCLKAFPQWGAYVVVGKGSGILRSARIEKRSSREKAIPRRKGDRL